MSGADFVRDTLGHIDLGVWPALSAEQLAGSPEMVRGFPSRDAAARALKYARLRGRIPYDEIGFRWLAATPVKGYVPLQTFAQARRDGERERRRTSPADLDLMLTQTRKLRHRPLAIPDGRLKFTIQDDLINLTQVAEPGRPDDGLMWSFPLGAPPKELLDFADDRDEPLLLTQHSPQNVPRVFWLPLPALIDAGRFGRMQEITADLVPHTSPGNYYCFISHRWLTPTLPDPDGRQARLIAWQLVAALCEAVYVAHERGLHTPRRISKFGNVPLGPFGSDLAEALIVNVLRPGLDASDLTALHSEILALQRETADRGVLAGHADSDLGRLRTLIAEHPRLRQLLDRVFVWYDYSCLPQQPRTPLEQQAFEQDLRETEIHQLLGRTAILLDDADDYLTRAWCTLEAVIADTAGSFDILVGSDRPTVSAGRTEHHLTTLLADRPHVIWRALLDTELFGIQTPAECLRRLELSATNETDLPAIYDGLRRLGIPRKVHLDESEVLTGTFPLPLTDRGRTILVPTSSDTQERRVVGTASLDWAAATLLDDRRERASRTPSFVELKGAGRCHVVVIGSCEGEAMMIADWVLTHAPGLAEVAGAGVRSLSWLATDIAPVGHFADGVLRTAMVDAPLWVLVAADTRFTRCPTTISLANSIVAAGLPYVAVALDIRRDNVTRHAPVQGAGSNVTRRVDAKRAETAEWRGGLFRVHLFDELRRTLPGESP
ncbi:hypothetical protein [Nocardia terpenica]|uniref:Uncharacterized protein n=1 Tax=Nocardia terpenica TaxID=455432 RepID=A0A291RI61_9NOCA|nr:hypothetical protein [Nocardia terpenica]ATL67256.1 hypothetical protein CRH09_14680 [Nocardia terpenica]